MALHGRACAKSGPRQPRKPLTGRPAYHDRTGLMMVKIIAFGCLLGAMPRHQMALFGRKLSARSTYICRVTGWSLLAALFDGTIAASGLAYGLCSFIGSCTAGGACFTLFFCWKTASKEQQVRRQ